MYQYKVSVVMAVYNVELYLREAIESVVQQDIGFEHIQLILVDDGSKDGSGAICDEYASKYPNNVVVVHKENGGVSTARNEGLKHVQGQYVNFLDSDDKFSTDTFKLVCEFFSKNEEDVDLVSCKLVFFDGSSGDHVLNYKYKNGSRVIDLNKEWDAAQLHISSSFIKSECLNTLSFDPRLAYAEDAKLIQRILLRKHKLGVIGDAIYWYRRRSNGEQSAIQTSTMRKGWYLPYMYHFQLETISYCKENIHFVPLFVQYTLMYDLQWRFQQKHIPNTVLNEQEKREYYQLLYQVLQYIDDDVIESQRNINRAHKLLVMKFKHKAKPQVVFQKDDICLAFDSCIRFRFSESPLKLEFVNLGRTKCTLDGVLSTLPDSVEKITVVAKVNSSLYEAELIRNRHSMIAFDQEVQKYKAFRISFPLLKGNEHLIEFFCRADDILIPLKHVAFGSFFPLGKEYVNSHYAKNSWLLQPHSDGICIQPSSSKLLCKLELGLYKELWPGDLKAILIRFCVAALRKIPRRPIWLISDRIMKAGDNGEAFFRYMRANHPEINTFFVINENSPDYKELETVGNVIKNGSYHHKLYHLLSNCIISSSADLGFCNPFYEFSDIYRDLTADTKFIFLQHGVIKDDLSRWAGRFNKNISGFVTSAKPEYDSIAFGAYEYNENQVWLTGLPRFDRLYRDEQKWITVMPTWRKYLSSDLSEKTATWTLIPNVENSEFVQFFSSLLNDSRLLSATKKYGYHLKFFPHPNFQTHLNLFKPNDAVDFLGIETKYRDVYAKSELIITDYSSAIFDFAYLRKPVLYAQFDAERFFSGEHSYDKGYFDYERDGFGEVEYTLEDTVNRIIQYMENGCKLKDKYRQRIDNFFAFDDQNNCERVYQKIIELGENKGV